MLVGQIFILSKKKQLPPDWKQLFCVSGQTQVVGPAHDLVQRYIEDYRHGRVPERTKVGQPVIFSPEGLLGHEQPTSLLCQALLAALGHDAVDPLIGLPARSKDAGNDHPLLGFGQADCLDAEAYGQDWVAVLEASAMVTPVPRLGQDSSEGTETAGDPVLDGRRGR